MLIELGRWGHGHRPHGDSGGNRWWSKPLVTTVWPSLRVTVGLNGLLALLLGREDQLEVLDDRFRELGSGRRPTTSGGGRHSPDGPSPARLDDYRDRRKEFLLALLHDDADNLDKAADELGAFFDRLRAIGIRGFVAEKLNDANYNRQPEHRRSRLQRGRQLPT